MGQRYGDLVKVRRAEEKRLRKDAKRKERKATRFIGWWRRDTGSPWRRIVHDADETRCLNRLLNAVRGGDKTVLLAGKNPNAREQS